MPGGIFISYRRQESSDFAGRLYDRLVNRFGEDRVFMDIDDIPLGVDIGPVIDEAVGACQVLLAVIGPQWLTTTDKHDRRRLDNPDDFVRLEVQAALEGGLRVIPILIGGATMPVREELPDSLGKLVVHNGLAIRHESFGSDVARLSATIEQIVETSTAAAEPAPTARPVSPGRRPVAVRLAPKAVCVVSHPSEVSGVAFSPDGRLLATACWDNTARLWTVGSWREHARVAHDDAVIGVAFSPDGQLLATASRDGTARLWEVASGREHGHLSHDGMVLGVAFSPDGRLLATACSDNTARLWEMPA